MTGGERSISSCWIKGIMGVWNDMNEPPSFNGPLPDDVVFTEEDEITNHKWMHNVYGHNMSKATLSGDCAD